ncbi:DUF3006 family protein [uncultured Ruminococcus sp.]|uniref:DUF3006 family protein n=1 Tax=uncultured Ruminococcus sp. TaxID=165186 RepID=UPI00292F5A02|nr:DUF3006 family protein [uncultured Ruminococcus sp.]
MRVIVDRIEEDVVIVEADDENTYQLPIALCPDVKEGDTIEISVIGKLPPKEEPHAIFERLRKNSKRKKDVNKLAKNETPAENIPFKKGSENPD